ncbi:MAG: DUF2961 domain-containing protein [Bacteroidetes bacterium]|nr:DUF2961 domain-containing protein [Bacteroidota bacterium]
MVKIWIDDSLIVASDLRGLFRNVHGVFRPPLDSEASGAFVCDIQLCYKKNFRVTEFTAPNNCCLFWGVEYRPMPDSSEIESALTRFPITEQQQHAAEEAYHRSGSPWDTTASVRHVLPQMLVAAGESVLIDSLRGPGLLQELHVDVDTAEFAALSDLRLRIYWDGNPTPSVDVPVPDFFGCGAGFRTVNAFQIRADLGGHFTCYLPMPFAEQAVIRLENFGSKTVHLGGGQLLYSPEAVNRHDEGYLYAQFSESKPAHWKRYHPVAHALGRGRFIGVFFALPDYPIASYLEGNPYFFVDSSEQNTVWYTGTEDYCNGGWYFRDHTFSLPFAGCTHEYSSIYRFHYLDALDFEKSLDYEHQHGVNNDFQTWYRTVGFLYKRWTPFWPSHDSLDRAEQWNIQGKGYRPGQAIDISIDTTHLRSMTAGIDGSFTADLTIPASVPSGIHRLSVNGEVRPEPIFVLSDPTVRFLNDTNPPVFRAGDSLILDGQGFIPGERVRIYVDTAEVNYLSIPTVSSLNDLHATIRLPWLPESVYRIRVRGDRGSEALTRSFQLTRTLSYEFEDLPVIYSEWTYQSSPVYLGWYPYADWSNTTGYLFYPDGPSRKIKFGFNVPVSDTFAVSMYHIIGLRYGNYDLYLDSMFVGSLHGYLDTDWSMPMRSAPLELGIHYLTAGSHDLMFRCTGHDSSAVDFLMDADNMILTPTTAYHSLKQPGDSSTDVETLPGPFARLSENPVRSDRAILRYSLGSSSPTDGATITADVFDILGRRVRSSSGLQTSQSVGSIELDCRGLANGKYFVIVHGIDGLSSSNTTLPMVLDR